MVYIIFHNHKDQAFGCRMTCFSSIVENICANLIFIIIKQIMFIHRAINAQCRGVTLHLTRAGQVNVMMGK